MPLYSHALFVSLTGSTSATSQTGPLPSIESLLEVFVSNFNKCQSLPHFYINTALTSHYTFPQLHRPQLNVCACVRPIDTLFRETLAKHIGFIRVKHTYIAHPTNAPTFTSHKHTHLRHKHTMHTPYYNTDV